MKNNLENLFEYLDSEEGKIYTNNFFRKLNNEKLIYESQLERFNNKNNFQEFILKVIKKYESKTYKDKWYKLSIEPPEFFYFFLYDYAEKYGRECNQEEYEKYGNMFTSRMYYYDGYYFNLIHGQGSCVLIFKEKE